MQILESFLIGKSGAPTGGDDRIVLTPAFAAIIDGATAKTPAPVFGERTSGSVVADALATAVATLDATSDAPSAITKLTQIIERDVYKAYGLSPATGDERPCACLLMYSAARREIWRVGDSHFAINGDIHYGTRRVDELTSAYRAAINRALLAAGWSVEQLTHNDRGRAAIASLLQSQALLINSEAAGKYAYAAMDGRPVPPSFIEVIPVPPGAEIILASDGYPQLKATLAESEAWLADYLKQDPLLIGVHASTKGVAYGQISFDDRSWLRLQT